MDSRLRDILLFTAGLGVLIHQTIVAVYPSATLVGASLTMMVGAPAVYHLLSMFDPPSKDGDDRS